jgi:glycosyltransferase involved in cell wall biosynthesis
MHQKGGYEVCLVGRFQAESKTFEHADFQSKRLHLFFSKGKFFYIEYNIRLFFWLLFQSFDAVCGNDLDTILPCLLACRNSLLKFSAFFSRKKITLKSCVYDAHELFSEVPEVISRPTIRQIWLRVEAYAIPRVSACYTVSESVANIFFERYGRKFEVIENFPKKLISNTLSDFNSKKKIILYQGNLNEGRGLETAVRAMQHFEYAMFWIVGDGALMSELRAIVADLKLEDRVHFWGFITPAQLPEITRKAHVGIHISEDKGLSYRMSLGNKFLDYIQAGIPQICTRFVEYEKFNNLYNIALLIEKTDENLYIEAVNRLFETPNLYNTLQQNALKARHHLCWENVEIRLLKIYADNMPQKYEP